MAYFSPYVDSTGLHIPQYSDIRDSLVATAKQIYGSDIYLESDSQDYQYISAVSNMINDAFLLVQAEYAARSPISATGAALSSLVKLNGINRLAATQSTVILTLTGTAGTVINSAIVTDVNGINWGFDTATIGSGGTAIVTATCENYGSIKAAPGEISIISTPTTGWTAVTNASAATTGIDLETDTQLRKRQQVAVAQPTRSVLEGLAGALESLIGVTRLKIYENDTDSANTYGPEHSISVVIEGGVNADVAQIIYLKKTPGCYTNGSTSVGVTSGSLSTTTIRFYRPTAIEIDVVVNVKSIQSYTTQTTTDIKTSITDYINSLDIGANITVSSLWGSALSAMPNLKNPIFGITSLTAGKHGASQGTSDIVIAFNEAAHGTITNITVNVT